MKYFIIMTKPDGNKTCNVSKSQTTAARMWGQNRPKHLTCCISKCCSLTLVTFVLPSWYYKGSRPVMNYLAGTRTVDMCSLFDFFSWESVKCLWKDDRTNSTNIAFVLLGRLSSILQSSWNWRCVSVFSRISLSRISSNLQLLAMWRVEKGVFARLMYWLDLIY